MFRHILAILLCFISALAVLLLWKKDLPDPDTYPPLVMYQDDLYITDPNGDASTEDPENMIHVGKITSIVPSNRLPAKTLEANFEVYMDGEVYIHPDGSMHVVLKNGKQVRHVKINAE